MVKAIIKFLTVIAVTLVVHAATVTLQWDPNDPSDGVSKYRIYSIQGTNWVQLGYSVTTSYVATGLPDGFLQFRVTAVNTNNLEGPPSNVVSTNLVPATVTPKAPANPKITSAAP